MHTHLVENKPFLFDDHSSKVKINFLAFAWDTLNLVHQEQLYKCGHHSSSSGPLNPLGEPIERERGCLMEPT